MSESRCYYVAVNPRKFIGVSVGTGHCVPFVQKATSPKVPLTKDWRPGESVEGNLTIEHGTAIATFQEGEYHNRTDGYSHAAIYLDQNERGMRVLHQWIRKDKTKQRVKESFIEFRGGEGKPNADASAFSIIETLCDGNDE